MCPLDTYALALHHQDSGHALDGTWGLLARGLWIVASALCRYCAPRVHSLAVKMSMTVRKEIYFLTIQLYPTLLLYDNPTHDVH